MTAAATGDVPAPGPTALEVDKLTTGIPGFDHVALGGLPRNRVTVVAGPAGSAKTVFCGQFLAAGAAMGEGGVYVSLEEPADDLRRNFATLGFDAARWEEASLWAFVDASPPLEDDEEDDAPYVLDTLAAQVGRAVDRTSATRVVIDSLGPVISGLDSALVRRRLRRLLVGLRRLGVTIMLTVETPPEESGEVHAMLGQEQYLADNVVLLRHLREGEKRRRTIEVLKMRGARHRKGAYPFTVLPGEGIVVIPVAVTELSQESSDVRVTSGNAGLDELCHGGFFRDSVVLVTGATGTGKTLLSTEFLAGGAERGERSLLFAFEESPAQLMRNATGWGRDYAALCDEGALRIVPFYPEVASLEDHLVEIKRVVDDYRPQRIAIDSLSALERAGTARGFREFVIGLTSYIKSLQVAAMFTASTTQLLGGTSVTETHISTLTDAIILLRYVESFGAIRRGISVIKMRGSDHDRDIREYTISGNGLTVGEPFRNVGGILTGNNVSLSSFDEGFDDVLPAR